MKHIGEYVRFDYRMVIENQILKLRIVLQYQRIPSSAISTEITPEDV